MKSNEREALLEIGIAEAAEAIRDCDSIWIGAGAGMGVDSGLPDFRGNEGFWNAYPPYRNLGLSFYDLANPRWFSLKPTQAWGFYGHRLRLYRQTNPHEGFSILQKWASAKDNDCFVFTSNVDGQFQKAGFREEQVVECHGSIHWLQCSGSCCERIWSAASYLPMIDENSMCAEEPLPRCERCDRVARPNILMFDDWNWLSSRSSEQANRYNDWLARTSRTIRNRVVLEFGAGTAVPSVRREAENVKGTLIRVNPREPETRQGISIQLGALEFLRRVDKLLEPGT